MRTPAFWYLPKPGLGALCLAPIGCLYMAATRRLVARSPRYRATVPVLCVGNLSAGGAGKTPVVIDLVRRLQSRGIDAHVLMRGYGGREKGPLRVDPDRHTAHDVGDEALLTGRNAPVWICRDRAVGGRAAVDAGAGALVMDDGLQNPDLAKDVNLIVVDGTRGFGNRLGIPAGPLRERITEGQGRATAVLVMGEDRYGLSSLLANAGTPVLGARIVPGPDGEDLRGRRVVAFAGLGDPEKFFSTLRSLGADLAATRPFPDHHVYRESEISALQGLAEAEDALAVTTEKDAVRLQPSARSRVRTLTIGVKWDNEAVLDDVILRPMMVRR